MNEEVFALLKELCPDFGPYDHLKYDRYAGTLGKNKVYVKVDNEGRMGMITGKRNMAKYGLDAFPTNFVTYTTYSYGKEEHGWTVDELLKVLKHIKGFTCL